MSLSSYRKFLFEKIKFYHYSNSRFRTDDDYPWKLINYDRKITVRELLKKSALLCKIHDYLKGGPERRWQWLDDALDKIYEVRCLLDDDLSKLLYDEAIVLKATSYQKFFFPKLYTSPILEIISQHTFNQEGLPHNYLDIPLVKFQVKNKTNSKVINLIAMKKFPEMINSYQQYLISRGSIDFRPMPGDVIFDCGSCIGDMSILFASYCGPTGEVHAFDPVPLHMNFCKLQAAQNPDLSKALNFVTFAIGKETKEINYGQKTDSSEIAPGGLSIDNFNVISLDDYANQEKISKLNFIKMDIESAETDALAGAENIIKAFKPKLAISIYHRPEDFWSIPLQIKKMQPNYKIAFAHHSPASAESVIYAY